MKNTKTVPEKQTLIALIHYEMQAGYMVGGFWVHVKSLRYGDGEVFEGKTVRAAMMKAIKWMEEK